MHLLHTPFKVPEAFEIQQAGGLGGCPIHNSPGDKTSRVLWPNHNEFRGSLLPPQGAGKVHAVGLKGNVARV